MKFLHILAALSLVLFIGCGGGSGDEQQTEGDTGETETTTEARTIEIIGIDQMQFVVSDDANTEGITLGDPVGSDGLQRLEGITVAPGEEVHIRLTTQSDLNPAAMAHNWLLLTMDADVEAFAAAAAQARDNDYVPSDMNDQVLAKTGLAAGGETTEVTFTAPEETGEYEFICTFPGHFSAGMRGILTVEETDMDASSD